MILCLFVLFVGASQPPTYEKDILEKNKISETSVREDQKSFYDVINGKSQEVLRYIRTTKDELHQQQKQLREKFEDQLKKELNEFKKADPRATVEPFRKEANEKRRQFLEKLNLEKKTLEQQLSAYKKSFEDFVKIQKDKFQNDLKVLTAKKKATGTIPSALESEFQQIPAGPGIQLKPE